MRSRLQPSLNIRIPDWLVEIGAISLLWLLFISQFAPAPAFSENGLDSGPLLTALFDPTMRQTGLEHERLAGVLLPVKIGLTRYGHIPTWNPYIGMGEPIINNAFSYLFNPFHSLPVLLADSFVQGTKLATWLALLLGGVNAWVLARVIGMGGAARVLVGALYMMSGGIAGKFHAGHFQLALSLAWPPLVLACLWWTLRSRTRLAPVAFGVSFALLFFAGNIYYVLHTLLCCAVITAAHLVKPPSVSAASEGSTRKSLLRRAALAGVFAFGLAAAQFFPVWLTRDFISHDGDPALESRYSLTEAVRYFITPAAELESTTADIDHLIAVDYAYIGPTVFLLIAAGFVVLLVRPQPISGAKKRAAFIAFLLAVAMMVWGAGQTGILHYLYANIPLLAEFRFVGRAHTIAGLWWVVLAGIALDLLWHAARSMTDLLPAFNRYDRVRLLRIAVVVGGVWLYFLAYSAGNSSTRLGMVLYNYSLLNTFDAGRFTSFQGAVNVLWGWLLAGFMVDTALLAIGYFLPGRWRQADYPLRPALATRGLRLGALFIMLLALAYVMGATGPLYSYRPHNASYTAAYPDIRAADREPFPAIREPFSPLAYAGYEAEMRNAGLDEGWLPLAINGLIPVENGALSTPSRWAFVTNAFGGASRDFARQFVSHNGFVQWRCYALHAAVDDPCALELENTSLVVYENAAALPYAFIAPLAEVVTRPGTLSGATVTPVMTLDHRQDSLTIEANAPDEDYLLIVREMNFPGWRASVDGEPIQPITTQTEHRIDQPRGYIALYMRPGRHTYELWFEPPGFALGLVISLATVIGMAGYLIWGRRVVLLENMSYSQAKAERIDTDG